MSLAAFHAKTASGEGAHGPDRSRLAKWNHCRTHRQKRQYAAGTESAGAIYRNRSGHWLGTRDVSVLALGSALPRAVLLAYGQECTCLTALSALVARDSPRERQIGRAHV